MPIEGGEPVLLTGADQSETINMQLEYDPTFSLNLFRSIIRTLQFVVPKSNPVRRYENAS